ncbi:MAG: excinuclease ABC subunit C [Clostridia bacterium]|nr:excinuclease ABC subunit C [Clostridia bacterium]
MDEERIKRLKEIVKKIPYEPGIYLMKDENGTIIYVGKAKSLRKRVRQYFIKSNKTTRILKMVEKIQNIEYIVTANELEALVLECNYIKEYSPKYNVMLKDDKSYPYIKITINEEFPSVYMTRKLANDGARYFGPYTDVKGVRDILNTIKEIFPLKRCKYNLNKIANKSVGPCLYYHIGRCLGPCINEVTKADYKQMIDQIIMFLDGKDKQIAEYIENQIQECILKLEFEKAAVLKQRKDKIKSIFSKQNVSNLTEVSSDIWGYCILEDTAYIQIFKIRGGKLLKHDNLETQDVSKEDFINSLITTIATYYSSCSDIPNKIYFKSEKNDEENNIVLGEYIKNIKGTKVDVISPKKGEKLKLINMIENNININHEEKQKNVLEDLRELLNINYEINSIEAYDISNLRNEYIVGAYVTYENNYLNKSKYRKFKIKSTETQNDVLSMSEVIQRRIKHMDEWELPDLICIDGGLGQVNVVKDILKNHKLDIPVIGMIKDDKHRTRGIIDLNGCEIDLRQDKKYKRVFNFLTFLQDEVHRFVIAYHRKLRDKIKGTEK